MPSARAADRSTAEPPTRSSRRLRASPACRVMTSGPTSGSMRKLREQGLGDVTLERRGDVTLAVPTALARLQGGHARLEREHALEHEPRRPSAAELRRA